MFLYHPFYCEENAWHLTQHDALRGREPAALFITSRARATPLWSQRAAPAPGEPVIWDYHVVALTLAGRAQLFDPDCTVGCPLDHEAWWRATFPIQLDALPPDYQPMFRIVPHDALAATFSSDRAHMRDGSGGWLQPPPAWEPIGRGPATLMRYLDLDDAIAGEVLDHSALKALLDATGALTR